MFDHTTNKWRVSFKEAKYPRIFIYDASGIGKSVRMHRLLALAFIPNPDNKPCIDHIDRNPANNSIENLRWVNHQENMQNVSKQVNKSSQYLGVSYRKHTKKWAALIPTGGNRKVLGSFDTELVT